MTRYAVIGCSDCDALTVTRRDDAASPQCGRSWPKAERKALALADSREAAVEKRGQLLRERWSG